MPDSTTTRGRGGRAVMTAVSGGGAAAAATTPALHGTGIPDSVRAAARQAFETRRPDVALAELVHDSLDDRGGTSGRRSLQFHGRGVDLTVDVTTGANGSRTLEVRTGSPGVRLVQVASPDSAVDIAPQVWRLDGIRPGLVSLVCDTEAGRVRTAWVRL